MTRPRIVPTMIALLVLATLSSVAVADKEHVVPSWMCGGYFVIPIEVDGPDGSRVTLQALFDTGGAQLSIEPEAVKRLWGEKIARGEHFRLQGAHAGPLRFATLNPKGRSMTHLSRLIGFDIDLFLPFKAFRSVLLTLDFPGREIRIASGRLPKPNGVSVFDARGPYRKPYLAVDIGDARRRLLIDSGASGSFSIRDQGSLSWIEAPLPLRSTQGMDRMSFHDIGRLDDDVEIAGVPIPDPIVVVTEGTELFGTRVMNRFVWTFDQKKKRVKIEPSSDEPIVLDGVHGSGAVLLPSDAGFEVARVLDDTPADSAGIRVGDLVVAMDGTPVYESGCERWERERGGSRVLSILRDGRRFDIKVEWAELVP